MKSNMASKRPRSLMNASKGRPSTMSCSTRCRSLSQMRKLSPPTAAVTGLGTEPIIPSICDTRAAECPAKSTKNDKNVLSGLGLLQLLPPLLQGCGDPPPLLQILLEGAVSGAVLPHHSQFFPLDISQLRTAVLGAGQVVRWGSSRGATARRKRSTSEAASMTWGCMSLDSSERRSPCRARICPRSGSQESGMYQYYHGIN